MSTSRISDITKTHSIEGIDLNVNLVNGKYILSTNIIDLFKDNYNISIDLNYIGDDTFSFFNFHLGPHLRLSINEYIRFTGHTVEYIDGTDVKHSGYRYYEEEINNNIFWYFQFSDGLDLKAKYNMTLSDDTIILYDNLGNYKEYIRSNNEYEIFLLKRIVYIGKNNNYTIEKVLTYDEDDRLLRIYDSRRPAYYIKFLYNENNYIEKICYEARYKTYGVLLHYDETGNLNSITRIVNKDTYLSHVFKYEDSKLSQIINVYTYESIKIDYSNDPQDAYKIDTIEEGYVNKKIFAFKNTIYSNEENTKSDIFVAKRDVINTDNTFTAKNVYNYTYNTNNQNTIVRCASTIPNEGIITYIYEYDMFGRLMSVFERESEYNFKTISRSNGVWLVDASEDQTGNYPNGKHKETINGIYSKYVSNNEIIYDENSVIVNDFITYHNKYKNASGEDNLIYNFKVSVKLFNPSSTNYIIVSIQYTDNTWKQFDARIIKYETGVYQTVSVQVEVDTHKTVKKISYFVDSTSFIINDMYASIGLNTITRFSNTYFKRELKDIIDISITNYNNTTDIISLSTNYYITYNDVYNTYLSYIRNTFLFNNNSFDLYLNEGRHIKRVKSVLYLSPNENWLLYDNTDNYRFTLQNGTYNMFNDTLTTKNYYFYETYNNYSNVLLEVEKSGTNNKKVIYDLKGNILETVDSYNVVTKYEYDNYYQLTKQEISHNNESEKFINKITRTIEYTKEETYLGSNTYYYDDIGNITQNVIKDTNNAIIRSKIYHKDGLDNVVQIEDGNHKNNIRYEVNGNISSYNSIYDNLDINNKIINHTFTYDDENRFFRHYQLSKNLLDENDNYRISTYYDDSNRSVTTYFRRSGLLDTAISTYNKYGNITSIKYNDNNNYINYFYENIDESSICANIKNINDNIEGLYKTFTYEDGTLNKIEEKDVNDDLIIKKEVFPSTEKYSFIYDDYERLYTYNQTYDLNKVSPRLESLSNDVFENTYEYDYFGRIKKISTNDLSNPFEQSISYETISLNNELYATSRIIEQEYNLRPGLSNPYFNVLTFNYVYDRLNNISAYDLVANNSLNHHYNDHYYSYTYNNDSVLTREQVWERDANLSTLSYKEINYTYDSHGNITSKNIKDGSDENHIINNTTYNYYYQNNKLENIYDSNNQLISSFSYDDFGNTTSYDGLNLTYIRGSVLSSISDGTNTYNYHYNSDGIRYKKIINNAETIYGLDGNKIIYEKGVNNFLYLYEGNEIIGLYDSGTHEKFFYVKDVTGNIISIIHNNVEVNRYKYDAYGNCEVYTYNHNGELVIDNTNYSIGNRNPFRYKSYYFDKESGLYYLNSRYYSPKIGRFITIDYINYIDESSIYGYNLYCYCGNNPIMYVDPSGHSALLAICLFAVSSLAMWGVSELFGAQIAGGIGSVTGGATAISTGISLCAFGPLGIFAGIALMAVGGLTIAFGANEIVDGVTGTNYIQDWTGWSDEVYNGVYIGLNVASAVGSIAGNIGMRIASNHILKGIVNNPESVQQYRLWQLKTYGKYTTQYVPGTLRKGEHIGQGYTLTHVKGGPKGYIQWHPGSRHHYNGLPYWKVTSALGGTWRGRYLF